MCNVNFNEEKNGIELMFDEKPDAKTLETIKAAGFRWHRQKKIWYAKQSEKTMEVANMFSSDKTNHEKEMKVEVKNNDLWELTRIADDVNNVDKELTVKEIAATIRKHTKSRFPMCKFSVRNLRHRYIDIDLLESPFEKDSDELKAIVHYVYKYAESYNYCWNYDPYGDYGSDYNFYGVYEGDIVSSSYQQTEMTVSVANMCEDFQTKKAAWEESERIREEKEFEEYCKQREAEKLEWERLEKIRKENQKKIESGAVVEDVSFTVLNTKEAHLNKNNTIAKYEEECAKEDGYIRRHCEVTKAVRFDKETYELFANALLDDFSFLANTGGSRTYDNRVNDMVDWNMMDNAERETVEWISVECVAIYCEDKLMFIVDTRGYNYARYVFLLDDESTIEDYHCEQVVSDEEMNDYRRVAEEILDASTSIIAINDFGDTWKTGGVNAKKYREKLAQWIEDMRVPFSSEVVRALDEGYGDTKQVWYKILTEIQGVQHQFRKADLQKGQRVTICFINEWGMMCKWKVTVEYVKYERYAQYEDAVMLAFTMQGKRKLLGQWFYRDVVIYDGWIDIPEDILWEDLGNGMRKTKYHSCDNRNYDDIMKYLKSEGHLPIVNTYKQVAA